MSSKDKVTKALEIIGKSMDELDRAYGILYDLKEGLTNPPKGEGCQNPDHFMCYGWCSDVTNKLNDECGAQ